MMTWILWIPITLGVSCNFWGSCDSSVTAMELKWRFNTEQECQAAITEYRFYDGRNRVTPACEEWRP